MGTFGKQPASSDGKPIPLHRLFDTLKDLLEEAGHEAFTPARIAQLMDEELGDKRSQETMDSLMQTFIYRLGLKEAYLENALEAALTHHPGTPSSLENVLHAHVLLLVRNPTLRELIMWRRGSDRHWLAPVDEARMEFIGFLVSIIPPVNNYRLAWLVTAIENLALAIAKKATEGFDLPLDTKEGHDRLRELIGDAVRKL